MLKIWCSSISSALRKYTNAYQNRIGKKAPMGTIIKGLLRSPDYKMKDFDIEINEIIDENEEKSLEIIQNSLEIFSIIWQYILMDVPLRVLHPDAKEESIEGDGWRLITEDDKKEVIDPRLSALSKFNKE